MISSVEWATHHKYSQVKTKIEKKALNYCEQGRASVIAISDLVKDNLSSDRFV